MRRLVTLALLLPLAMLSPAGPATAGVSCHRVDAQGAGLGAPARAGDAPGLIRTVARIRGGGLVQGTTAAAFQVTGSTQTGIAFAGDITFTTNRATLTVDLTGALDLGSGAFAASGDVSDATGKLDGATGTLAFAGTQNLLDPTGSFTETVSGEICVDLGGNGGT